MLKANPSEKTSYGTKFVPNQTRVSNSNTVSFPDIPITYSRHYGKCPLGGRFLINLVPMLEQKKQKTKKKNMRKVTFFQAVQCAALSSFTVRKMAF